MRVLAGIVIPPHLTYSGAVTAGKALSEAIAAHCSVDVAVMSQGDRESRLGAARLLEVEARTPFGPTARIFPERFRTLFYRSRIPELVRRQDYDLVHLHNPIPALELRRIALACRTRRIPYVISTHGFVEISSGGKAYRVNPLSSLAWRWWIERPIREVVDGAAMVFALSPAEKPVLEEFNVGEDRAEIVTNGVDTALYARRPEQEIQRLCERLDLPAEKDADVPVCVFLGNHTRNKGIDVMLDAFSAISLPFLLVVAGRRKPHNVDYERYQGQRGDRQRIVFTGEVTDDEARALFHYGDLLVFPTRADTLPLVVLEAMASGIPVLSTRIGGIPFQLDERCGLLVAPNDPGALAEGYRQLYQRRTSWPAMGEAGRVRVRERFDWSRSAEKAFRLYQEILDRYSGPNRSESDVHVNRDDSR